MPLRGSCCVLLAFNVSMLETSRMIVLKRLFLGAVLFAVLLIVGGPWVLYCVGLYGVDGRPEIARSNATESDVQAIWRNARGTGEAVIEPITPHEYAYLIYEGGKSKPSILVAWQVARHYMLDHQKYRGWWHLSGAALTIWLTRNWSSGQIFSKVAEIAREKAG
jgi:hypothetical protein